MQEYLDTIEQVVYYFPVLIILVAIPYFYFQYKKHKTVELYRSIIMFTFILYISCCYGLVILPLPTIEEVSQLTGPFIDMRLFGFLDDFFNYAVLDGSTGSLITALKSSLVYIPFFNLVMLIPFGIYQKKFFKNSLIKTVLLGFLLSLSFELIQLSALFGIYPHPYRLFQLDDLILNTLGALIGWLLVPKSKTNQPIRKNTPFVPSIKQRSIVFFLDMIILSIIMRVIAFILNRPTTINRFASDYTIYFIAVVIYFIIIPIYLGFKSPAGMLLDLSYTTRMGHKPPLQRFILRQLFLFGLIVPAPIIALYIIYSNLPVIFKYPIAVLLFMVPVILFVQLILNIVMTHEAISNIYLTSDRKRERLARQQVSQDQLTSLLSSSQDHRRG